MVSGALAFLGGFFGGKIDTFISRMIDIRAARADPDAYRAALARKGAEQDFDALMEADRAWLALVPRVDELRANLALRGPQCVLAGAEDRRERQVLRAGQCGRTARSGRRRGRGPRWGRG